MALPILSSFLRVGKHVALVNETQRMAICNNPRDLPLELGEVQPRPFAQVVFLNPLGLRKQASHKILCERRYLLAFLTIISHRLNRLGLAKLLNCAPDEMAHLCAGDDLVRSIYYPLHVRHRAPEPTRNCSGNLDSGENGLAPREARADLRSGLGCYRRQAVDRLCRCRGKLGEDGHGENSGGRVASAIRQW